MSTKLVYMRWHIGCSGFHYREWKAVFYPAGLPQKKWFEYYSSQFDTLELNVTFYRFPQLTFLQNWYKISPSAFSFAVKAPRLITHYKQFKECESLLDDFYNTISEGLNEKLGTVLFQFPPKFDFSAERLGLIMKHLRRSIKNVVEFRHLSWWNKAVYEAFQEKEIIFTGISHPTLPDDAVVNDTTAYYRFHGVPRLYYSEYSHETLQRIADSLLQEPTLTEAYIYFNNTAAVGAIENAIWIRNYVREKSL